MPSYYDSTKNKPGKAEVKYNEGGQVRRSDPEKREAVRDSLERITEAGKRILRSAITKAERPKKQMSRMRKAGQAGRVSPPLRKGPPAGMSKGGKLKVTGMGAATRGGNFTRNG